MDVAVDMPGLGELQKRLNRFDKPLKKRLFQLRKKGAKELQDRMRSGLSGMERLVAKQMKAFSKADSTGVRFRPTSGAKGPGMGIFAGAKKWPQFRPFIGVDPESGGHVFYPPARDYGPELARLTADEVDRFIAEEVAR